jgi:hypothetical protein
MKFKSNRQRKAVMAKLHSANWERMSDGYERNLKTGIYRATNKYGKFGIIHNRSVKKVSELDKKSDLQFVNADYEVSEIKKYAGKSADDYDSFFVKIKDGDYSEIWGITGIVPTLTKTAYRVK